MTNEQKQQALLNAAQEAKEHQIGTCVLSIGDDDTKTHKFLIGFDESSDSYHVYCNQLLSYRIFENTFFEAESLAKNVTNDTNNWQKYIDKDIQYKQDVINAYFNEILPQKQQIKEHFATPYEKRQLHKLDMTLESFSDSHRDLYGNKVCQGNNACTFGDDTFIGIGPYCKPCGGDKKDVTLFYTGDADDFSSASHEQIRDYCQIMHMHAVFISDYDGANGDSYLCFTTPDAVKEYYPKLTGLYHAAKQIETKPQNDIMYNIPFLDVPTEYLGKYAEKQNTNTKDKTDMKKETTKQMPYEIKKDAHGREKIFGVANINGTSKKITFSRNYGSHQFDDDEIQALLNGEEINIKNFKTRYGSEIDIKGSLGEQTYMGKKYIGFVKSDEPTKRREIDVPAAATEESKEFE